MEKQCCGICDYYSPLYYECNNDMQPQGDTIKNPEDGTDCDLFEPCDER